ncbi:MAG: condensation domain-containing protein, partial [Verrucomicrobiota bacterium]
MDFLIMGPQRSYRGFSAAHNGQVLQNDFILLHHIVADGWSRGVLMRELATGYRARVESTAPALPPLPIQYTDYA